MNSLKPIPYLACCVSFAFFACSEGGKKSTDPEQEANATYLRCNELMYNAGGADTLEWLEFQIESGPAISSMIAAELRIEGAVEYTFAEGSLEVGERVVVTNDTNAFRATYPYAEFPVRLFGPFIGRLNNAGEVVEVKLSGPGDASCSYSATPPWPHLAAGNGHSLVYVDGNPSYPESYGASVKKGGNPGGADSVLPNIAVRFNEVKPGLDPWIEFYNPSATAQDISGWLLSKTADGSAKTFTLPAGSVVPANGYWVLKEEIEGDWGDFFPATTGDLLYLIQTQGAEPTASLTGIEYPAIENGKSAGVVQLNSGELVRGPLETLTQGAANSGLVQGPLYISEIYYNPSEGGAEFLEITNRTAEAVNLYTPSFWKVEGIAFSFPAGAMVPANGKVVVVRAPGIEGADTAAFRATYQVDSKVPLFNYTGKLSNRGEQIEILKPLSMVTVNNASSYSYTWYDVVLYEDRGDWPEAADGEGKSLTRVHADRPGSDPSAWEAADPSPGK